MIPAQPAGPLAGFAAAWAGDVATALYIRPIVRLSAATADEAVERGSALYLAGGPLAFTQAEVILRAADGTVARAISPLGALRGWAEDIGGDLPERVDGWLYYLSARRGRFAGLRLDRPRIMGVVNATPDSFSDGGDAYEPGDAIAAGHALASAGADILDVGGESTRPGAEPVPAETETARVEAPVRALAEAGYCVSIDSRNAATQRAALDAGARIINDVTALTHDPASLEVARASQAPVVLMHMQGTPQTMQRDPRYNDVALDVFDALAERLAACEAAGISRERLCIDPGIGFGKTLDHNMGLLRQVGLFHGLGCPIMVGVSRKRFIAQLSRDEAAKERVPGSIAAHLAAVDQGVQIVRVHDVAETAQALAVWRGVNAVAPG